MYKPESSKPGVQSNVPVSFPWSVKNVCRVSTDKVMGSSLGSDEATVKVKALPSSTTFGPIGSSTGGSFGGGEMTRFTSTYCGEF
jgi:hypothetical protein